MKRVTVDLLQDLRSEMEARKIAPLPNGNYAIVVPEFGSIHPSILGEAGFEEATVNLDPAVGKEKK